MATFDAISDYRKQLNRGFRGLTFEPALEAEFRVRRHDKLARRTRLILAILGIYGLLYTISDYFLFGPGFSNTLLPLRNVVSNVLILLLIASTFRTPLRRWQDTLGIALGLHMGIVALLLTYVFNPVSSVDQFMLSTYVASSYFIYFCYSLRFWHALLVGYLLFGGLLVLILKDATSLSAAIYPLLLVSFPHLIGPIVLYGLEYNRRLSFLLEHDLDFISRHDHLTGLLGRRALLTDLQQLVTHCYRERQPLAIAVVDVDCFRDYNDIYGSVQGDACLRQVARLCRSQLSVPNGLVARYNGGQFSIALPGLDAAAALQLLETFRNALHALAMPHAGSAVADIVTASIGLIVVHPHLDHRSTRKLLQLADEAVADAKAQGRDRVRLGTAGHLAAALQLPDAGAAALLRTALA